MSLCYKYKYSYMKLIKIDFYDDWIKMDFFGYGEFYFEDGYDKLVKINKKDLIYIIYF